MAKKSTAVAKPAATAAAAPAAASTEVGVAAEFVVGTITIPISAKDLANIKENGLQFALPPGEVVKVPSIADFITELGKLFNVTLPMPTAEQLKGLPFAALFTQELTITRLSLNTKKGDFAIAIGFYPDPPVPIMDKGPLSAIKLKSLAFSVDRTGGEQPAT
jgi:hypothetical protein